MSNAPDPLQAAEANNTEPTQAGAAHGLRSLARRRTLLKGVGKAGAIAGAAIPLRSLATGDKPGMRLPKSNKYYVCSVSGENSIMASAQATTPTDCGARSLSHYKMINGLRTNWPGGASNPVCTVRGTNYTPDAIFSLVFDCKINSFYSAQKIGKLIESYPTSAEAHWVVAMLNANKFASNFPYSPAEVLAMCKDINNRVKSLAFFQNNLET